MDRSQYAVRERLPPDHRLYHLATERSDPWQYKSRSVHTWWETAQWGHVVANKERIRGKKRVPDPLAYKTHMAQETVEEEATVLGPNDERIRDNENGGWVQDTFVHMHERRKFLLDGEGERILKKYNTLR